jgi:hypothetical protein
VKKEAHNHLMVARAFPFFALPGKTGNLRITANGEA